MKLRKNEDGDYLSPRGDRVIYASQNDIAKRWIVGIHAIVDCGTDQAEAEALRDGLALAIDPSLAEPAKPIGDRELDELAINFSHAAATTNATIKDETLRVSRAIEVAVKHEQEAAFLAINKLREALYAERRKNAASTNPEPLLVKNEKGDWNSSADGKPFLVVTADEYDEDETAGFYVEMKIGPCSSKILKGCDTRKIAAVIDDQTDVENKTDMFERLISDRSFDSKKRTSISTPRPRRSKQWRNSWPACLNRKEIPMSEPKTLEDLIKSVDETHAQYASVFGTYPYGDPESIAAYSKWMEVIRRVGVALWEEADCDYAKTFRHGDMIYVLGESEPEYHVVNLEDCIDVSTIILSPASSVPSDDS